ncbi:MAG: hypothetical protein ABIH88_00425, partial [Patescibacteria group bacterium]
MQEHNRINFLLGVFFFFGFVIVLRLFYWQVIKGSSLASAAYNQHLASFEIPAKRGEILASDGFALVSNSKSYLVFASTPDLKEPTEEIIARLSPILSEADLSSDSAEI